MPKELPFKKIAETITVEEVAKMLGLRLDQDSRAACPACDGSDRTLELIPETNSFRCHAADPPPGKKVLAGDCIALYAHLRGYTGMYRAAKELWEPNGVSHTAPAQLPKNKKAGDDRPAHSRETGFDPTAFAEKLEFTDEVAALGISEEQAQALGIGVHRGKLYCAVRYVSGNVAGFLHVAGGKIALPKNLLPDASPNIVRFPKRA